MEEKENDSNALDFVKNCKTIAVAVATVILLAILIPVLVIVTINTNGTNNAYLAAVDAQSETSITRDSGIAHKVTLDDYGVYQIIT